VFEPVERKKVADSVAASLRDAIVGGRLARGEKLPSERELASQYEVNRSSIREALMRLEAWGLIEIRQGGATRVRDFLLSAGLQLLPHLVEPGGRVDHQLLGDLHDIRGMFLGWSAERAALKADAAAVGRLEALVVEMEVPQARPAQLQKLDYAFFEELVRTTGNRVLALIANVVRDVYMGQQHRFAQLYARGVFDPSHHRRAVEAIRLRDAAGASVAMRAHAASAVKADAGNRP
jgi:DNA-binding FadR family transcriptional regulator